MLTKENKAIARRFFQAWEGDFSVIDALASLELTVYYPPFSQVSMGGEAFKQEISAFHSTFTDVDMSIEREIAEGDRVVIIWRASGTHTGNFFGSQGTGKKVEWTGISVYKIADGKVVEEKGEENIFSLMLQLGVIPKQ